jgi:signal transduction histidine kinase
MKKIEKMKEKEKTLKQFLIRRFILIILLVAISEGFIRILFTKFLYPMLTSLLGFTDISVTNYSSEMLSDTVQVILTLIAICIFSLLPDYIAEAIKVILQRLNFTGLQIRLEVKLPIEIEFPMFEQLYYIGLLLVFLIILFLLLVPYLVAAIAFGRMVSKKVERPIHCLTEGMEQVMKGKLTTRLTFDTEHEFIQMRDTFNEMAEQMELNFNEKEEFEKRRNSLLSDIAHDLKTPMTTILGYATALTDGLIHDQDKEKQYLEAIKAKSLHMDELIVLLFEYVKLDSKGFTLNLQISDLAELLRENIALLYTDFETKNIEIDMDIPDAIVNYEVDWVQFSRVIGNLLNNAIRYNPQGSVVTIQMVVDNKIQIIIADNGAFIEKEIAEHIFDPFVTGDKARNTRSGSGLGLSIAKKIVTMHGGNLILDYKENPKYSKAFIISLPKQG